MKLFSFDYKQDGEYHNQFDEMSFNMAGFIIKICQGINKRQRNLIHTALFLFHCQVKIATFHRFDRFMYACAAILVATKLTQNVDYYPIQLIKTMRRILRQSKGIQEKQDEQQKLNNLVKKLFEAELIIMINIGFEFDLEIALFWINEWERIINNFDLSRKFQDNLTQLYKTNVVIYFKPQILALAAIQMAIQSQKLHFQLSKWNEMILARLKAEQINIKLVIEYYNNKILFLTKSY